MGSKAVRFEAKQDKGDDWYWIFYGGNGEEIARSTESYTDIRDCLHSIDLVRNTNRETTVKIERK